METIRISMLPNALDCCRRAAAGQFHDLLSDAGFTLNESRKGIYTIVGDGTHKGTEHMLTQKIKTGTLPPVQESIDVGIAEYETKISDSTDLVYDATTPDQGNGKLQIYRFIKFFQRDIAPKLVFPENADPAKCLEVRIERTHKGFKISGTVDIRTEYSIVDTKSGKERAHHSQLGGYANLSVSDGWEKPNNLLIGYLPRVHMDKPYPGTRIISYDVDFSMNEAWYLVNQLIRDVNNFKQSGNPACFQGNPQSTLCSEKYCRAYGTEFCKYY